ncbi:MAG: InlB B-repeat-containing protein [Prevotella sp.]|nr:InlB B-repeat-containing protein [Prevotella sp.]
MAGTTVVLPAQPSFSSNSGTEYSNGWLLDSQEITASYQVTPADNGKILRYFVTNACGTTYSNSLTLEVAYTVKFETNGGNALPDQIVVTGGLVAEPEPPAYYCYPFEGWFSDVSCTVAWNFTSCVITKDTTLYAKYGTVQTYDLYRWTGAADDQEWNNPDNWKKVVGGVEYSVQYPPTPCVDAEIPGGLTNYPKPTEAGAVRIIYLKDRAMVANTHNLTYDSAKVEVNFTVAERNRWVMYSAPLRKTYTGDFMLRDAMEIPMNGASNSAHPGAPAVYMSFFQTAYPDNPAYTATAKAFTQPFGKTDILLPLGKSFNIWIDTDVDTGTAFRFPSPHTKYSYWVHYPYGGAGTPVESDELIRTDGANNAVGNRINGRFIVEEAASTDPVTGEFTVTPPDDASGYEYLMAPNPFMAYLDMAAFLTANTASLQNHYKIWDGENGTFISYRPTPLYRPGLPYFGGTWWLASSPTAWDTPSGTAQYVSPLQSFIVEKKTPASIASLVYNPTTMTSAVYSPSTPYTLRNAKEASEPEGILYITVSQNRTKNSTALVNAPGASNGMGEDVGKLCFDNGEGLPQLSVYTLTPQREALDINLSGDFNDVEIPIGIRTNISGEIQLDFSGVAGFGYKVYLLDGWQEIDLAANPSYKTTITKTGSSEFYEINNRFVLKFPASGNDIKNASSRVHIQTEGGKIHLRSDDLMEAVEILSISGTTLFKSTDKVRFLAIDAMPGHAYIVRITTSKGVITHKVIAK